MAFKRPPKLTAVRPRGVSAQLSTMRSKESVRRWGITRY